MYRFPLQFIPAKAGTGMTWKMQDLTKQLNSLKKIQPSTQWKSSAREDILAQVMGEDSPQKLSLWAEFLYLIRFSGGFFHDFIMKPAGTMALVLILVLGGGIIKVKADGSLPGDLLYSLKRSGEKVHVALVFNKERKSDLLLSMLSERAKELNEVIYKEDVDQEEKIKEALNNFHKDFTPIKDTLTQDDHGEGVKIAKKVEDKTSELHFILSKAKDNIEGEDIERVIKDVNKVNFEALEVMASGAESGNEEAIAKKIDNKIDEISEKAQDKEDSSEALAKLDEAKEDLMVGNFVAALQKVRESNEILDSEEVVDTEATSTVELIMDEEIANEEATTTISGE